MFISEMAQQKGPCHLFGNILDKAEFERLASSIKIKIKNLEAGPSIPEKRRIGVGYRDKGHSPDVACGGALGKIDLGETMKKIEKNRKFNEDHKNLILGSLL